MTYPTVNVNLTNLDGSTDNPALARTDLLDLATKFNGLRPLPADLAASSGASLVGYQSAGAGAVAATVQAKLRERVSVKDFGAIGNGVADDTSAINAALASGAKHIIFPGGAYKITSAIVITNTTGLTLDGSNYGAKLDFSTLTTGYALSFGDGTTGASHCRLSGFLIQGGGGANGLRLNGGNPAGTTLNKFENLVISSFATNLTTALSWINKFDNVLLSNPTVRNAAFGAATNNCLFDRVSFIGGPNAATVVNCEGLQFNSPEFANVTGADAAFTLSQSNVSIVNPYFENITSNILASVGISSETTVKSGLIMTGGQCNVTDPVIRLGSDRVNIVVTGLQCTTNDIVFYDTGLNASTVYGLTAPSDVTTYPGKTGFTSQGNEMAEVFRGNKNYMPYVNDAGVSFVTKRGWLEMSSSIVGSGVTIASGLTVGAKYMIVLALRGTAFNAVLNGVGNNCVVLGVPATTENWNVQYIPVTASTTAIKLLTNNAADALQIRLIAVLKGHKFPRFDIYGQQQISSLAAPTTDTWKVGDRITNSVPIVGYPKGWLCTVAGTPGTWVSEGNL